MWPAARWSASYGPMAGKAWCGQKRSRTTVADPDATRPPDLVDRQFQVPAPNMLVVADVKCRLRHLTSYADPRNMPTLLAMVFCGNYFGPLRSA
jgi:hypothetical protein